MPTDVSDPRTVGALFAAVTDAWDRVDLLFNNAGTFGPIGPSTRSRSSDWRTVASEPDRGVPLCREAVAVMRGGAAGGRIINNGSISAHTPSGQRGYTATKHAITGLTKSISLDGRAYGIACGQIDIGNAATEMTASIARRYPAGGWVDLVPSRRSMPRSWATLFSLWPGYRWMPTYSS